MVIEFRRKSIARIGAAWLFLSACHANDQPAIATHLGFETQPSASVRPTSSLGNVTVALLTADDHTAVGSTAIVQLSLTGANGNAHLLGELSHGSAGGATTFSDLSVDSAGNGYRLVAKASGLDSAVSQPFSVRLLGRLHFDSIDHFQNVYVRMPPVSVHVVDDAGNLVSTATPPITIWTPVAGLAGTTTVTAVNGTAVFVDLSLQHWGGGLRLHASAPNFAPDSSNELFVQPAPCTQLVFFTQPSGGKAGAPLSSFTVSPADQYGNNCVALPPGGTMTVTAALGNNPSGATLSGDTIVTGFRAGTTLRNVVIDKAGTGYTLIVSTPGLASVTSNPFNVVP